MSLEKVTALNSVEIVFPSRSINVSWHTSIVEDGVVISGPSIHRTAFSAENSAEVIPEISSVVSADYLATVQENSVLKEEAITAAQLIAHLEAQVAALKLQLQNQGG
ncbi:hypothetical protein [Comamonas sp.]|uniref:hypothetical protein n=1 Tax=Comamonas sp. TaxID=34028 RepID=UPI0012CE52C4|nr:hypothetical protein [Comamonas sp.]MPT10922.1 hypothetical protein [Comamonas sp.]